MSYHEFERRVQQMPSLGEVVKMEPEVDLHDSSFRAQRLFDTAVVLRENSGAQRVIVEVNGPDVDYILLKEEPQKNIGKPSSSLGLDPDASVSKKPRLVRETKQQIGKKHDVRGLTGFYHGTYYDSGNARPRKKPR